MAFDILYLDRRDLTTRPLRDRRARLEHIVAGSDLVFPVRRLAPDGLEAWAQSSRRRRCVVRSTRRTGREAVRATGRRSHHAAPSLGGLPRTARFIKAKSEAIARRIA